MALIADWKIRCLICMKDVPARIPVFGPHGQRRDIRKMIAEFLNIKVKESDSHPDKICESCYETLQNINNLKRRAHESKDNLKLLKSFHQKEEEDRKVEHIRLWLGSQRNEQGEMAVFDEHDSQQQQQQQSDFMCSSISANEATSSIGLNISAIVSENSDVFNDTHSVSSDGASQEIPEHHKGRKRPGTPLPFSTPSSRSCSPQPGALPPESSRKQYRSAARSKIAVQQNGVDGLLEKSVDHSGSPQPGSLPPKTTGKSSASRKRSKNLPFNSEFGTPQSESNNPVSQESDLITKPEDRVVLHRAQSCSPLRGNTCRVSVLTLEGKKRGRGRQRSKSLPPSKRKKADIAEPNEAASKSTPWKPYVDDVCFGGITTSCDLKPFKKRIPVVKLQRLDDPQWTLKWPPFPQSQVSTEQPFILVEEIHDGIVQQLCWVCNKIFPSNENMQEHLMKHSFKTQAKVSSSKDLTEEPRSKGCFLCNLCNIYFCSNGFLQRHMKCHSEKKWSYKCTVCEETFQTRAILKRHMENHNISCQDCGAVFMAAEDLEKHRESHKQQQQVYTCSCCFQNFTSEQTLGKHMVHHRKCTLCNKTFKGKDELATHVGECHKVCNICDETVADEEELQAHIEMSHEKCNLCGKQFLFEEELSAHLKVHPYQCMMCLSAFNDKTQLMEHTNNSHQEMVELFKEVVAKKQTTV